MIHLRRFLMFKLLLFASLLDESHGQADGVTRLNYCFVVDTSGDVCNNDPDFDHVTGDSCSNWNFTRQFIHCLIENIPVESRNQTNRVALITFDSSAKVVFDLNRYSPADVQSLLSAIDRLQYDPKNSTFRDMEGALNLVNNQVFSQSDIASGKNRVVLITSGNPTNITWFENELNATKIKNFKTIVYGVTSQVDDNLLDKFDTRYTFKEYSDLRAAPSCSEGNSSLISLRLVNPSSAMTANDTMEGRLEIYYNGVWGTVCDDMFSDAGARVVCASLGFGRTGSFLGNTYGPGSGPIWLDGVQCKGNEQSITDCPHQDWLNTNCLHKEDLSISCKGNSSFFLRLINPNSTTTSNDTIEGRLEIYYNGVWGTVCDNFFKDTDAGASVVCASLGFGRTGSVIGHKYGPGTGPIWLDDVMCNGDELSIADCPRTGWNSSNCGHDEDVSIRCNLPTTTSSPTTSSLSVSTTRAELVSTLGPTTQQATTLTRSTVVIGTSKTNGGTVSNAGYTTQVAATTDGKVVSSAMFAMYNVSSVSKTLKTTTSSRLVPETSDSPEIVSIYPNYGPVSGGTKITIKGRNLDKYGGISFVYIGTMRLPIQNWTSSWSEFLVVTTAGDSSQVSVSQPLMFETAGGKNFSFHFSFTYFPDPEIEEVKPTMHLASGGTTLTIIGEYLNSSSSPYLRVIVNATTLDRLNENVTIINGPTCNVNSSNEIRCLMPRTNVEGTTIINLPSLGQRVSLEEPSKNKTNYITLTLRSDGAEDVTKPSVTFIAYRGELDPVESPMYFDPEDDVFIHIKGKDLNIGIGADDYEVFVGTDGCTNKTLTANELSCRPPTKEPDPGNEQARYCRASGEFPVIIFAGRKVDDGDRIKLHWSCLVYPGPWFSWWVVGVICGVSGLLLVVTVVCFVVCRQRRLRRKRETAERNVFFTTRPFVNSPDPGWARIQVDQQRSLRGKPMNTSNDTYSSRVTDNYLEPKMGDISPSDYNRRLVSDWTKSNINLDERSRQIAQYELDMVAAERDARDLQNPPSTRYSYGIFSGDVDTGYAAPHHRPDYISYEPGREMLSLPNWGNQMSRQHPTPQRQSAENNWRTTDGNGVIVAPALRANRHDFLGQSRGFNSPLYGSFELPTRSTGDLPGYRFGHRGQ